MRLINRKKGDLDIIQDIQKIIANNRVTRLIQKLFFSRRQRSTISFFKKYVIAERDIDREAEKEETTRDRGLDVDTQTLAHGFDPDESAWDRRLLYEVTGIRLRDQEFRGEDTSSDEEPAPSEADEDDERLYTGERKTKRTTFDIDGFNEVLAKMLNEEDQNPSGDGSALLGQPDTIN